MKKRYLCQFCKTFTTQVYSDARIGMAAFLRCRKCDGIIIAEVKK